MVFLDLKENWAESETNPKRPSQIYADQVDDISRHLGTY